MAHGVPVVASDVGGVREWLVDGENGYLVAPRKAEALSEALSEILMNGDLLEQMGVAGISRIQDKFLPEHHLSKLLQVYSSVKQT